MPLTMRRYKGEEDYWRIRAFLRQVFLLNDRQLGWQAAQLDYWRWHVIENCNSFPSLESGLFIWETGEGNLGAVLTPDGRGEAFLQVHPALYTPSLAEEMITTAEQHLAVKDADGKTKLCVWSSERDKMRQKVLIDREYTRGEWPGHEHQKDLGTPIPEGPVAPGYLVRPLGDVDELPARSWVSWRAFHPDEPDEDYEGWEWYHNIQRMPMYRRDLDIVAVAPGGEFAAFCTVWYDDVTRTGYFEPVGAAPEHQRLGLGKAVMCEALRRLKRMGATLATVSGFTAAASALYSSVMSPERHRFEPWKRTW